MAIVYTNVLKKKYFQRERYEGLEIRAAKENYFIMQENENLMEKT